MKTLNNINFIELSREELEETNKERAEHLEKATNGFIVEPPVLCPVINDLRYNYGFWYIRPFLIDNDGLKFELYTYTDKKQIHLAFIGVPDDKKQQGLGTQMMNALIEIADKYGYSIDLEVAPKFGVGKRVLKKFYKKFGFEKDSRPFRGNDCMIRFGLTVGSK